MMPVPARVLGLVWLVWPAAGPVPGAVQAARYVQTTAPAAPHPVRWSLREAADKPSGAGAEFRAVAEAEVAPGWHLYALDEPEGGPVPLEFSVPDEGAVTLVSVGARPPLRGSVPGNTEPVGFYVGQTRFVLRLRMRDRAAPAGRLAVSVRYQACNNRLCLPPCVEALVLPTPSRDRRNPAR